MSFLSLVLLFAVGTVAGFLNVFAGGGTLLSMPVMVFLGLPGPVANGSNRVAILVQNIAATAGFFRQGFSRFRLSLSLAFCTLPGALLGAYWGTKLEGPWFNRVLAAVMLGVLALMWKRKKGDLRNGGETPPADSPGSGRIVAAHVCMVGVGVYGGFIQAGVGFLIMAVLHRVLGLDLVRVNMHKVFIIGTYTIVALAVFAFEGRVWWDAGIALAAGNAIGGWVAAHAAVKRGDGAIRVVLNVVLVAMVIKLIADSFSAAG